METKIKIKKSNENVKQNHKRCNKKTCICVGVIFVWFSVIVYKYLL